MRKEIYSIKCPEHLVIGDPWYFETESAERLKDLVVDIKFPEHFAAALSIKETECNECMICGVFGHKDQIHTYLGGSFYEGQKEEVRKLYVDTAEYLFQVDGRSANIHTHEDGHWGQKTAFYTETQGKKHLDAYMFIVYTPDDMGFEEVKQTMGSLFEDMKLLPQKQKAKEKSTNEPKR